jgi:2'-5' RNA ligase
MKRLLSCLSFIFFIIYSLPCRATNVLITFDMSIEQKEKIYNDIVRNAGLSKQGPDKYHITLAWVKGVDPEDAENLKLFLREKLKERCETVIAIQNRESERGFSIRLDHAGRYLVGSRTPDGYSVVLYLSPQSTDQLKDINLYLSEQLGHFKGRKPYQFVPDVSPDNFLPHITVANQAYIKNVLANPDDVISRLNQNLRKAWGDNPEFYEFDLRG